MRKKKVVVLTMNPNAGQSYRANLEEAVGEENLEIQVYTPSTYRNAGNVANADAYLISTGSIDYEDEIIDRIPSKAWGDPKVFKDVVVFLASEASNYICGATIPVDGGFLCR